MPEDWLKAVVIIIFTRHKGLDALQLHVTKAIRFNPRNPL